MSDLIIVESPNKAKKIAKLYPKAAVKATVGHFRDLPVTEMGVSPPEHVPQYEVDPDKEMVLASLRKAANNATKIWIAADPDREGEAIAWHTQFCLGQKHAAKCKRITFTEVNKRSIDKAMGSPRGIDMNQVRAQEARRVIDRYVGYLVSPPLKQKLVSLGAVTDAAKISAGRVQSVAVKLLVELENTIKNFSPVEHYGVTANLQHAGIEFNAVWDFSMLPALPDGQKIWTDKVTADFVKETTTALRLIDSKKESKANKPMPPLTTSDLVKSANRLFKFSTKKAMDLAQKLFEQGLITYHRTDSPSMSEDFVSTVRSFAVQQGLSVPDEPRKYRASGDSQEGHECCRVTDITQSKPAELTDPDQIKLYHMVWQRTLASQLSDEIMSVLSYTFLTPTNYTFVSKSSQQTSPGWRQLIPKEKKKKQSSSSNDEGDENQSSLPSLNVGDELLVQLAELHVKHTKPPSRLMERNLVSELEKRGIGRPSTYASIINTILNRSYADYNEKGQITPTPLGFVMCNAIDRRFGFMDYKFTAGVETLLDQIATGKQRYLEIVDHIYKQTEQELQWFNAAEIDIPAETIQAASQYVASQGQTESKKQSPKGRSAKAQKKTRNITAIGSPCQAQECNGTRVERQFKNGKNSGKRYLGCTNFPTCKQFDWLD